MGEAKRRKNATRWVCQIVLCYEQEPYLAFDVTAAMLEQALALEQELTTAETVHDWLIINLNQLREDVALIRDHSDELMREPGRRDLLACKAIVVVHVLLAQKQLNLATVRAVIFNLTAHQSTVESQAPGFHLGVLAEPLSVEEIRAMSTAQHMYMQQGDTLEKLPPPPSQKSKDRSKDRTCIGILALWHNDQPGGIALETVINEGEGQTSLDIEMDAIDAIIMKLAETQAPSKDIDDFLHHIAQQKTTTENVAEALYIMAVIAYAEESGYMASDEYNGMVYMYHTDQNGYFIDRKDQPLQRP